MNELKYKNSHCLRNIFASYNGYGVIFKTIQEQLNHAHVNISISTYGPLTDEVKVKDLKIFNKLM